MSKEFKKFKKNISENLDKLETGIKVNIVNNELRMNNLMNLHIDPSNPTTSNNYLYKDALVEKAAIVKGMVVIASSILGELQSLREASKI